MKKICIPSEYSHPKNHRGKRRNGNESDTRSSHQTQGDAVWMIQTLLVDFLQPLMDAFSGHHRDATSVSIFQGAVYW